MSNPQIGQVEPVKKGERISMPGWEHLPVFVKHVDYDIDEARWVITLDWGEHGTSRVYDHDEGKTWNRYRELN